MLARCSMLADAQFAICEFVNAGQTARLSIDRPLILSFSTYQLNTVPVGPWHRSGPFDSPAISASSLAVQLVFISTSCASADRASFWWHRQHASFRNCSPHLPSTSRVQPARPPVLPVSGRGAVPVLLLRPPQLPVLIARPKQLSRSRLPAPREVPRRARELARRPSPMRCSILSSLLSAQEF